MEWGEPQLNNHMQHMLMEYHVSLYESKRVYQGGQRDEYQHHVIRE